MCLKGRRVATPRTHSPPRQGVYLKLEAKPGGKRINILHIEVPRGVRAISEDQADSFLTVESRCSHESVLGNASRGLPSSVKEFRTQDACSRPSGYSLLRLVPFGRLVRNRACASVCRRLISATVHKPGLYGGYRHLSKPSVSRNCSARQLHSSSFPIPTWCSVFFPSLHL